MSAPALAPLFELGRIVATPGALEATTPIQRQHYLSLHARGDFGEMCDEDVEVNRAAIAEGDRVLSVYPIDPGKPCNGFRKNCLWIITEADRSVTTFLLSSEY